MNLLYHRCNDYDYNTNLDFTVTSEEKDLYCPLNVDTEFYMRELNDSEYNQNPSPTITVQVRGIEKDSIGTIYSHLDCEDIARHPLMTLPFIGFQYLKDNGYNIEFTRPKIINYDYLKSLPKIHFHLYAHFIVADLARIFYGDYRQDILNLIINAKNGSGSGITQERRTRSYTKYGQRFDEYIPMNWLLKLNGIDYQVCIELRDTNGIAGVAGYADLAVLSGIELKYKDSLVTVEKENMKDTYINSDKFDDYALGDLYCHDMTVGINERFLNVQRLIGIPENDLIPIRLTIGSSIARLVEYLISSKLNNRQLFKKLTEDANSDELRKLKDTRAIMSKVDGGRCFNNRPLDIVVNKKKYDNFNEFITELNSLCDIDINGAYGRGLSLQDYPLGTPKMFNHLLNKNNKYPTLRELLYKGYYSNSGKFIKPIINQLEDGLWTMRVSSKTRLKYPQDFIISWIVDPNKISRLETEDKDDISVDYPKIGYTKIFSNEIIYGTLTSDILDLIENVCSRDQKNELLDNLVVINAVWYDKTQVTDNLLEVEENIDNVELQDESYYIDDTRENKQYGSYKWYRLNIGELLINKLLFLRSQTKKKSPDNEFYKLCINTTYGVLVSKYFPISNTVVGNNITARCRMMAWYMEKGLNGFQTITDGCVFELDKVVYPVKGKRLTANNLVRGYSKDIRDKQWYLDKLKINEYQNLYHNKEFIGQIKKEEVSNIIKYMTTPDEEDRITKPEKLIIAKYILDNKAIIPTDIVYNVEKDILEHLRNVFPNVKVLHKQVINSDGIEQTGYYTLEIKCFSGNGVFHGNANYKLNDLFKIKDNEIIPVLDGNGNIVNEIYKMRGYKSNRCYVLNDESLESTEIEVDGFLLDETTFFNESYEKTSVNVPKEFLDNLEIFFSNLPLLKPFLQQTIIKCKDYKQKYNSTYKDSNLCIGHTEIKSRLVPVLNLSQFTFLTQNQWEKWNDKHKKLKEKNGLGYESLFFDGLNVQYDLLIKTIDESIRENKTLRLTAKKHPYLKQLLDIKQAITNASDENLD